MTVICSIILSVLFLLYTKYVYEWGYTSGALDEIERTLEDINGETVS